MTRFLLSLCLGVFLAASLAGCASAPKPQRSVYLFRGSERVGGVYFDGYGYDKRMMAKISHLLRDRTTDETYPIDPKLIDVLYDLISKLALPETQEIEVLSGYRSQGHNAEMALVNADVARNSYHMKGQAMDIRLPGITGKAIAAVAITMQSGGVAYYPKTGHVHVDTGPTRTWTPPSAQSSSKSGKTSQAATR